MPKLAYFGQTPGHGTGSPIVIYRHLARLREEGWEIAVFVERGQDQTACKRIGIEVHTLPLRRFWWPPYRPSSPISRTIRMRLWATEARKELEGVAPTVCLSYLSIHSHDMAELASVFATRVKAPLVMIVHDDTTAFKFKAASRTAIVEAHTRILRSSSRCLFVSPELAERFNLPEAKKQTLLPIPAGFMAEEPALRRHQPLNFYYAGAVWPNQLPLFRDIARVLRESSCALTIIAKPTDELARFCGDNEIRLLPLFPTNQEALQHLADHADALLVAYSRRMEDMEWIRTSFPSKLIEFSHLKRPIWVVAPPQSSVARFLAKEAPDLLISPSELDRLATNARQLRDPVFEGACCKTVDRLAAGPFSPEKIHRQFKSHLDAAVASS